MDQKVADTGKYNSEEVIQDVYGLADEVRMKLQTMDSAEEMAREILMEIESVDPQLIMNENGNELGVDVQNEMMQNPMMNPMLIANQSEILFARQSEMAQRQMTMINAALTTLGNSGGAPVQFGNGMCSSNCHFH